MAEKTMPDTTTQAARPDLENPLPSVNDPGGAEAKGYSADPRPEKQVQSQGSIPLAPGHEGTTQVHQPEREGKVNPTGRREPGSYTPNERLMGSDR